MTRKSTQPKYSVLALLTIAISAFFILTGNSTSVQNPTDFTVSTNSTKTSTDGKPIYRFTDPVLAYKVLYLLDTYIAPNQTQYLRNERAYLGLKRDDTYCKKHRAHFVTYPESVFGQMNFVHDWRPKSFVTSILNKIGNDLHTQNTRFMTLQQRKVPTHNVMPSANFFFTAPPLFSYLDPTTQFSCLSQASNDIPGGGNLALKDRVARAASLYLNKYSDRPQCLASDEYFPKTWVLYNVLECREFFKGLNSLEYKKLQKERGIVYIKKEPNTHRGEGVQPLNQEEEALLRERYGNGKLCGRVQDNLIIQHYIHNSLLLNGRKFDFRIYLLVASVNPLIAYYHDGFLRVSLGEYDVTSNDKAVLLTNLALNKMIYSEAEKGNLYEGMDQEALKLSQQWSYDRLQAYLLDKGIISDSNWLDNYLRPQFHRALVHLTRLSLGAAIPHSSFYCLYGVDFMLDEDLNLWFIEANAGADFDGYSKPMGIFIEKMLKDHFEIVYGLLRSRMKRVVEFVNELMEKNEAKEKANKGGPDRIFIKDYPEKKKIFDEITKNYFEKEFEVGEDNGWKKIIDENEKGVDAYQGIITAECL